MADTPFIYFPKKPLYATFAFVIATLVLATLGRGMKETPLQLMGEAETVASRMLRFEDRADGAVIVIDHETGGVIATAEPGTNGFLRGALRGMMRARKRDGLANSAPMKLEQRADGELVLIDSALGTVIALNAFGRTNAAVFGTMLTEKQGSLK